MRKLTECIKETLFCGTDALTGNSPIVRILLMCSRRSSKKSSTGDVNVFENVFSEGKSNVLNLAVSLYWGVRKSNLVLKNSRVALSHGTGLESIQYEVLVSRIVHNPKVDILDTPAQRKITAVRQCNDWQRLLTLRLLLPLIKFEMKRRFVRQIVSNKYEVHDLDSPLSKQRNSSDHVKWTIWSVLLPVDFIFEIWNMLLAYAQSSTLKSKSASWRSYRTTDNPHLAPPVSILNRPRHRIARCTRKTSVKLRLINNKNCTMILFFGAITVDNANVAVQWVTLQTQLRDLGVSKFNNNNNGQAEG